jgi:ABC-type uncharacterized transport system substrate-binding protein
MALMTAPWRRTGVAVAAGLLASAPAAAHPHVFIDYAVTVQFDDAGITGVRLSWTFDEMYSSMLFHDYTSRPHGALSAADIKSLEQGAFKDTADYHYFIDMTMNGKAVPVTEATDFTARYEQHRMTYSFTVPVHGDAAARNTLEVAAFDHEFYIDFELAKKSAVAVEHGEKLAAACAPKTQRKDTSTFGPMDAVVVACTYGTG